MQLGMIGLGRMGANIVRRLLAGGHDCVVFDLEADRVAGLAAEGATPAGSLAEVVEQLDGPRAVWVMLPAAAVASAIAQLTGLLSPGDTIIDGGNTFYRDDIDRAARLAPQGVHLVDCGTSGGVWGRQRGYCLMVGGEDEVVARLAPIFETLAPGVGSAERTLGRTGDPEPAEHGWLHCGPPGAGHFVKMVHNGIEYGLMAAYAEGLNILAHAGVGNHQHDVDAETAPMRSPEYFRYDLDVAAIAELWRRGSVISSWLLDLTAAALVADPTLEAFAGRVSDSGEGRWTAAAAIEVGAPAPVLTAALYDRFSSRGEGDFARKVLSAMRKEFGGHGEKPPVGL